MTQIEITPDLEWAKVLRKMKKGDVVLMRNGHAVALLQQFDDEELYWYTRQQDPEFIASIARARKRAAKGQTISHEEMKKRLGID
jgi:hypothetical protein